MRTKINLVIAVILAITTVQSHNAAAQDASAPVRKIHYIVDIGVNISLFNQKNAPFMMPDLVTEYKRTVRTSWEFGGSLDYSMSKLADLSVGARYSGKGGSYKAKNPAYVWQYSNGKKEDAYNYLNYRLDYVELPVLLKFKATSKISICGGIASMFNVGSKLRYNYFEHDEEEWDSMELDAAKPFVAGWVFGNRIFSNREVRRMGSLFRYFDRCV